MAEYDYHEKVKGWRMPIDETHFVNWMLHNPKTKYVREVDGRMTYQYHKYERALKYVSGRGLAMDIGAHVGFWAWYMCRDFGHVICVEPAPPHIEMLNYNMRDRTNWSLWEIGLCNDPTVSTMTMDIPKGESGNAHIDCGKDHPGNKYGQHVFDTFEIQMSTLDEEWGMFRFNWEAGADETPRVDFLKIDVEGYEYPVLSGGESFLLENKPVMVVEQKGSDVAYGFKHLEAKKYLESLGAREVDVIAGDYTMVWD